MTAKQILIIIGAIVAALIAYTIVADPNDGKQTQRTIQNQGGQESSQVEEGVAEEDGTDVTAATCNSEECLKVDGLEYPVGDLPTSVKDALDQAIDDEYKARATYEAVINELGSVRPFSMIIRSEEQHISSLKALYDKYGLDIPADPYTNVSIANTKAENCSIGVEDEVTNAALYRDNLLPAVADYPDITSVFTNLMNASQNNHLPAFERCAN